MIQMILQWQLQKCILDLKNKNYQPSFQPIIRRTVKNARDIPISIYTAFTFQALGTGDKREVLPR